MNFQYFPRHVFNGGRDYEAFVCGEHGCALVGLVVQANAADLGRAPPVAPAPVYAPVYSWTGLYLGVNGGGGWGNSTWTGSSTGLQHLGRPVRRQLGYNWQFGQTVLGLETDIQWSDIKGSGACAFGCETRTTGSAPCAAVSATPRIASCLT